MQCCGKANYTDYKVNITGTCCGKIEMPKEETCAGGNHTVYEEGCTEAYEKEVYKKYIEFIVLYSLAIVFSGLCSLFAFLLWKQLKAAVSEAK